MKKHIPNAITCANLLSGCLGIVFAFDQNLIWAAYAIFIAAIFDFLDGMVARLLHAYSETGKELDSLADVVSFGVLPGVIIFELFLQAPQIEGVSKYLNFSAFIIVVFSALRLAKFNVDIRQSENFIGLPTPANALLIASFPIILAQGNSFLSAYILNPFFLACFVLIMSSLLIAELPLISLKFKSLGFNENIYRYLLLILSLICFVIFKFAAIPVIVIIYITLSVIQFRFAK
ncbi:MAG: CDP-diacylglycerol--serine O-phosphatidyltransferase [Sphingobacteriaceae bacterium]